MTTKAKKLYHSLNSKNDMLLFGKESLRVQKRYIKCSKINKNTMNKKTRSLNVAMSVAIVAVKL